MSHSQNDQLDFYMESAEYYFDILPEPNFSPFTSTEQSMKYERRKKASPSIIVSA